MRLLSLPSATVLGLQIVAFMIHPIVRATHMHDKKNKKESANVDLNNQVNYYSDLGCEHYQGTWHGPSTRLGTGEGFPITLNNEYIGSVLLLSGTQKNFTTITANGHDANGHDVAKLAGFNNQVRAECYLINETITTITLYYFSLDML
jgi:hypothetical protein